MENSPWQIRAKQAGLSQKSLAALVGTTEIAVSRAIRGHLLSGTPGYLIATILAWEIMTHEQREEWIRRRTDGGYFSVPPPK